MSDVPSERPVPSGEPRGVAAWAGLILAVPLALGVYFALDHFTAESHVTRAAAAITVLMGVLWVTEAMPLAATSLLPLVLFPLTGVLTFKEAAAPYADYNIYIYLGGFIIALAIERWGLHRRIALHTLLLVGTSPARLVAGIMLATALLSMWISNTATTAMMLPLGLSLVALVQQHAAGRAEDWSERDAARFAVCMMLGIAYAATIGGLGTLIGTPTNVAFAAFAANKEIPIGFSKWMAFAMPLVMVYLAFTWVLLTRWLYPLPRGEMEDGRTLVQRELDDLGPVSRGEVAVMLVFLATAAMWMLREPLQDSDWVQTRWPAISKYLNDGTIALIGALALFLIPVYPRRGVFAMDWETCKRLPWGVLLLFGGGLSLAAAVEQSGLATLIGGQVAGWGSGSLLLLAILVTAAVIFASEFASNTATVTALLPIMYGVSQSLSGDPLLLCVATTVAASYAFMLPVGTPPNAIVFGTGLIQQRQMMFAGLWLNLLGIVLIPLAVYTLGVWVLGIRV